MTTSRTGLRLGEVFERSGARRSGLVHIPIDLCAIPLVHQDCLCDELPPRLSALDVIEHYGRHTRMEAWPTGAPNRVLNDEWVWLSYLHLECKKLHQPADWDSFAALVHQETMKVRPSVPMLARVSDMLSELRQELVSAARSDLDLLFGGAPRRLVVIATPRWSRVCGGVAALAVRHGQLAVAEILSWLEDQARAEGAETVRRKYQSNVLETAGVLYDPPSVDLVQALALAEKLL